MVGIREIPGHFTLPIAFLLLLLFLIFSLAGESGNAIEYHGDLVLNGVVENVTIDLWGDLIVANLSSLSLRNVTLVFHNDGGVQHGIVIGNGASLSILDNDGQGSTTRDQSFIDSLGIPWRLEADYAETVRIEHSHLNHMGRPDSGGIPSFDVTITAYSKIVVEDVTFTQLGGYIFMSSPLGRSCLGNSTCRGVEPSVFVEGTIVAIENTTFESDGEYALLVSSSVGSIINCSISGNGTHGITLDGTVKAANCTVRGFTYGIWVNSRSAVNISGCDILDCPTGIFVEERTRTEVSATRLIDCGHGFIGEKILMAGLMGCAFQNLSEVAVEIVFDGRGLSATLADCIFESARHCLRAYPSDDSAGRVFALVNVTGCRFSGFDCAMDVSMIELIVSNSSLDGGSEVSPSAVGIRSVHPGPDDVIQCVRLVETNIEDCIAGIDIADAYDVMISSTVLVRCGSGARIINATRLQVIGLSMDGCGDGLYIGSIYDSDIEGIAATSIARRTIVMETVRESLWTISGPTLFEGCDFRVVGEVRVNAELTLRNSSIYLKSDNGSVPRLSVQSGVRATLHASGVVGDTMCPLELDVLEGALFHCEGSTLMRMGLHSPVESRAGLVALGCQLELIDTFMTECPISIAAVDSTLYLENCTIDAEVSALTLDRSSASIVKGRMTGSDQAILTRDSVVRLELSLVRALTSILIATDSDLNLVACTLSCEIGGIDCHSCEMTMHSVSFDAPGATFRLNHTCLDLWNSTLLTEGRTCELSGNSTMRLFASSWSGDLLISDRASTVEWLDEHKLRVAYNWSSEVPVGLAVSVVPSNHEYPSSVALSDGAGAISGLWLVESVAHWTGAIAVGPYAFLHDQGGLRGEVTCDDGPYWAGDLVLYDIRPPTLGLRRPTTDVLQNRPDLIIEGNGSEIGSGISYFRYRVDSGEWTGLDLATDKWSVQLNLTDGAHVFRLALEDRAGHLATVVLNITVDTRPPVVAFDYPNNGSLLRSLVIAIAGHASDPPGHPLLYARLNGLPLALDGGGNFTSDWTMDLEGIHSFILEAMDWAGNTATLYLVVYVDITPPSLEISPIPSLTNLPMVSISGFGEDANGLVLKLDGVERMHFQSLMFTLDVNLTEGANSLLVTAEDPFGNTASKRLDITLDTMLNATIARPLEGETLLGDVVTVEVTTDPGAMVRVVSLSNWTAAGPSGTVSFRLPLGLGEHSITVELRDVANNTLTRELNFTLVRAREDGDAMSRRWPYLAAVTALACLGLAATAMLVRRRRRRGRPRS